MNTLSKPSSSVHEDIHDEEYNKFRTWFFNQKNVRGEQVSQVAWKAWQECRRQILVKIESI